MEQSIANAIRTNYYGTIIFKNFEIFIFQKSILVLIKINVNLFFISCFNTSSFIIKFIFYGK